MIYLINSLYFKGTAYSKNKKFLNSFISFIRVCYRHFGLPILSLLECGKYHINAEFKIAVLFSYITKVEVCLSSPIWFGICDENKTRRDYRSWIWAIFIQNFSPQHTPTPESSSFNTVGVIAYAVRTAPQTTLLLQMVLMSLAYRVVSHLKFG